MALLLHMIGATDTLKLGCTPDIVRLWTVLSLGRY